MAVDEEKVGPDTSDQVLGTTNDDVMDEGYEDSQGNIIGSGDAVDKVNGHAGSDVINTGGGSDLAAGDMVGQEWTFVDGKWVYNADAIHQGAGVTRDYDDRITTGDGDDVLLGNGGNDELFAGAGDDRINAGTGNDSAFGGAGSDTLNLEDGNDFGVGGLGADTVNAGAGNDVVYGDLFAQNLLQTTDGASPTSFAQYESGGNWTVTEENGQTSMTQSVSTNAGEPYMVSFEVAANLAGGAASAKVEVMWNGEVIGEVEVTSGVYEKHEIEVPGGGDGELTFREVAPPDTGPEINMDGPIAFYEKEVDIGGEDVSVAAFAPGQAKLYQVIDGQLKVFDTASETYEDAGPATGFKVNAIGFNVEDDLIYGIAKSSGKDALGNDINAPDLVMMDAEGNAYRIGDVPHGDYVGDFDDSGNLWSFNSKVDRVTKIDVDNLDANGNPVTVDYPLPPDLFQGRAYDIAYSSKDDCFYVVEAPKKNGGEGAVHKIDISGVEAGGTPEITSIPINGTLYDDGMESGMAKGAYGAVFLDGDGNLYFGMNRGDHDLDGSTAVSGAVYGVEMDWANGSAYAKFMSTAQNTGSNDGAVDPRSADAFAEVDTEATVLIRNPEVKSLDGGDDHLRGGEGEDLIYGGGGDDVIHGGDDDDVLHGDHGNDKVYGGEGNDEVYGGAGNDRLYGDAGDDKMEGGAGNDVMHGGTGNDSMSGGDGNDQMYGGDGNDIMSGGAGNDKLYGGSGNNTIDGGSGDDKIFAKGGNDDLSGGAGNDFIMAGAGDDILHGGDGNDKLVGGKGADTIEGGAGNDHLWGGEWSGDGSSDTFIVSAGGGKDMIHDFEADHDVLDLSSYGLEFSDLSNLMSDKGWATEIDLSGLDGGQAGDKLILKSIDPDDLDESNFIL